MHVYIGNVLPCMDMVIWSYMDMAITECEISKTRFSIRPDIIIILLLFYYYIIIILGVMTTLN